MAAIAGRLCLVKLDNTGGGSYQTVGGGRTKTLKINSEAVDVTNADSPNQWRELLANAGVKSVDVTLGGVFIDDAYINQALAYAKDNTIRNWQFIHTGIGTFQAAFDVEIELEGEYNDAMMYEVTLRSAGELTFTPS